MNKVFITIFCFSTFISASCQKCQTPDSALLLLDNSLANSNIPFEFSSLAKWNDGNSTKILLVPALKKSLFKKEIYIIDSSAIADVLCKKKNINLKVEDTITIEGEIFTTIYNDSNYDGIEATCVIGQNIYFSIETFQKDDFCYIAKGVIENRSIHIIKAIKIKKNIPLKNKKFAADAGFESLTSVNGALVAIFEKYDDSLDEETLFYTIDLKLDTAKSGYYGEIGNKTRLADITVTDNKELIGIASSKPEYGESIYNIVCLENNTFKVKRSIKKIGKKLNWEGIIPFLDGFLLINDNTMGVTKDQTALLFVRL